MVKAPTTHEQFRKQFEHMGFDVSQDTEPPEDEEYGVLVAENGNGDKVFFCMLQKSNDWGYHFDCDRFSIDDNEFRPREVELDGRTIVLEGLTGTRSKRTGYGVAGWDGTLRIDHQKAEVTEQHTNTYR